HREVLTPGLRNAKGRAPKPGPTCYAVFSTLRLRLPEHLRDLIDRVEELLALRGVVGLLGVAGFLRRVPEQLVQVRILLEVLGLEVVRPEHPQMMLHEVRPLFLDRDGALAEFGVVRSLVLLLARLDGLGLDASLRGVIDPARKVAVRGKRP